MVWGLSLSFFFLSSFLSILVFFLSFFFLFFFSFLFDAKAGAPAMCHLIVGTPDL